MKTSWLPGMSFTCMEGFFDSIAIKNSESRNLSFFAKASYWIEISFHVYTLVCDPTVWSIEIILHSNLLHFSSRKMAITKRQRLPKKERDLTSCTEKNDLWAFLFPSCFRAAKKLSDQKHVALFVLCHLTPFSSYCHYERYTSHNTYLLAIAFAQSTNLLFTPLLCKFSFQFFKNTYLKLVTL